MIVSKSPILVNSVWLKGLVLVFALLVLPLGAQLSAKDIHGLNDAVKEYDRAEYSLQQPKTMVFVGDSAKNLAGWDLIGNRPASLEDHLGKWVLVNFWTSDNEIYLDLLPSLLEAVNPLLNRDDFAMFSVSMDSKDTLSSLEAVIDKFGITYPVLYDEGGMSSSLADGWANHYKGIGAFLVSPQGVVVDKGYHNLCGDTMGPVLDYYLSYEGVYDPVGLRTSRVLNDDKTVDVLVEISSPSHELLNLTVDVWYQRVTWAEDDPNHEEPPVERENIDPGGPDPEYDLEIEFTETDDATLRFTIPAVDGTDIALYHVVIPIPGTEHLVNGDGLLTTWVGTIFLH